MTGAVARSPSGAMRGPGMPTIVWLIAGTGVWLALVGATRARLTMTKGGAPRPGLRNHDAAGRLEARLGAIAIDVREPRLARATSAIAQGGPGPRRRCPP